MPRGPDHVPFHVKAKVQSFEKCDDVKVNVSVLDG